MSYFVKIHQVEAELLHVNRRNDNRTDGRRDTTKLTAALYNFVNAPKNDDIVAHMEELGS
jgi:hypothetical protein